jgi:predicted alpha-1,6-mannanase (GH76 family)
VAAVGKTKLLIACAAVLVAAGWTGLNTEGKRANLARATTAFDALQRHFASTGAVYTDATPGKGASSAWSFSQALAATIELAKADPAYRPAVQAQLATLARYWNGRGYRPYPLGGWVYLDDNEWIGQDLVAAYELLGRKQLLQRAQTVFDLVADAWDVDSSDACSGGVFWTHDPTNTDRNTVSTANGALLALDLYRETHQASYLGWARKMYAWVDRCLAASDGLYSDHLSKRGDVDGHEWSYNQGAMIAAGTLLYVATHDARYLARATTLTRATLARFGPSNFAGEPSAFVAILFRDIRRLNAVKPDARYAAAAQRYADANWGTSKSTLLDQSAIVDLYAALAR